MRDRDWDNSHGLVQGDIKSPETGPGEAGRPMSIFILCVANRQLNYQPFSQLKMRLFCSQLLSSLFSKAQRKAAPGQKAHGCCLFSPPSPHPRQRPLRFLPQKQTAGQCLQQLLSLVVPSQYNLIVHFWTAGWISSHFNRARKSYQLHQKSLRKVKR